MTANRFCCLALLLRRLMLQGPMLLGLLLLPTAATADDNAALMQAVQAFLYEQASHHGDEIVIEVRPPSAHLATCESPEPFLTHASQAVLGNVSVGVRCGPQGRHVRYMQAEVGVIGEYPVLTRQVAPGSEITAEMLEMRRGDLSRLPQRTLLDTDAIIGQIAQRALTAGVPLREHQLEARALVERGQQVVVEASGAGFRVTREGEALGAGGQGERIRVRFANRELVTARVIGDARLAVDF